MFLKGCKYRRCREKAIFIISVFVYLYIYSKFWHSDEGFFRFYCIFFLISRLWYFPKWNIIIFLYFCLLGKCCHKIDYFMLLWASTKKPNKIISIYSSSMFSHFKKYSPILWILDTLYNWLGDSLKNFKDWKWMKNCYNINRGYN